MALIHIMAYPYHPQIACVETEAQTGQGRGQGHTAGQWQSDPGSSGQAAHPGASFRAWMFAAGGKEGATPPTAPRSPGKSG